MKNAAYKFSVIIPVYNVEPYIRRCVDSVLAQIFRDFEIVLVDDGSPDNCGKIATSMPHEMKGSSAFISRTAGFPPLATRD